MIYLDHAAATPIDSRVWTAMRPYFSVRFFNPSALYLPAQAVAKDINRARAAVAQILGAKPAEIIFTAGGTEANNLAIAGILQRFPDGEVVCSSIEHESILRPAAMYPFRITPVHKDGVINLEELEKSITNKTVLVSVMYANNEIGTIQPIKDVAKLLQQIRKKRQQNGTKLPLYLHTDACQAANYLDLHVSRLGVDFMTLNGGKIYGPKQSGVLYVRAGVAIEPLIRGGGQEGGLRSGTENIAGIIGFSSALGLVQAKRHEETRRLQKLQAAFFKGLKEDVPSSSVNGSMKHRLPNNLHLTLPGQDNERLLIKLEQKGILAAAGSACSASNEKPSHVLAAIGLSEATIRSSLRLTMGQATSVSDIIRTLKALTRVLE